MRTPEEVALVASLIAEGLNDCEIARRTGIPRQTILDWRVGRRPNFDGRRVYEPGADPQLDASAEPAYSYLLGLYLGDGHIARTPRTYRLRITLDGLYPEIVEACKAAIEVVVPNSAHVVLTPSRAVVVSAYSGAWPQLFPQHAPGLKHLRKIELVPWQRAITRRRPEDLIRGLIHSDGARSMNRIRHPHKTYVYPRYEFSNRSDDIRTIFCNHLDLLRIPWRRMNRWTISVARREGVARLDEFVGPKC
jgi:hypothetical protein